ncbi:hypothetical protein PRJ_1970 [Pseudomonas sp. XWY-1]|nr:hypothetical protein PRJ_1970 [Pseudomonas sp. XWY-1]
MVAAVHSELPLLGGAGRDAQVAGFPPVDIVIASAGVSPKRILRPASEISEVKGGIYAQRLDVGR